MKVIALLLIKFFFISALFIISNGNLHLGDIGQREIFLNSYSVWLNNVFGQIVQTAGYVVNSKWLPENNLSNSS